MKNLIWGIFIFLISSSQIFPQTGWFTLYSNPTYNHYSINFINTNTGWVSGTTGIIRKTTNGGLNWVDRTTGTTNTLFGIHFVNEFTGWSAGSEGTILKSTNGGENWVIQASGVTVHLRSVYFVNTNTGWVAGDTGTILKTTNGGNGWFKQTSGIITKGFSSVFFINSDYGWAVGARDTITRTTNGGLNWINISTFPNNTYYSVHFVNINTGYVTGTSGTPGVIIKTTDGGNQWTTVFNEPSTYYFNSVYFPNTDTGWVAGYYGGILKTTNGGLNWNPNYSNVNNNLMSVFFKDANTGWTTGTGSIILKTTNGGTSLISIDPLEIPDYYYLGQNYPNPFNSLTRINFAIPTQSFVSLTVYDTRGKEYITLVNEYLSEGRYEIMLNAEGFNSGIYLYKIRAGNYSETKKMVFIK